jgi:hypothetical protein
MIKNLYWKIRFWLAGFKYYPIGGSGTISKDFTFSAGATIIASEHNTNFDSLYNLVNGQIEDINIASGAAIANSKLNLASIGQDITHTGTAIFTGTVSTQGDTNIGNGADSLVINCSSGITYTPSATWTFTAGQTVSGTWTDLGIVTTVDINGGTIDNTDTTLTSLQLTETTAPATAASEGALYTKDTSGQPELFFREESSGDEVQVTSGGSVAPNISQETFLIDGAFVAPTGITQILVTMVAGGGGGGGGKGDTSLGGGGGGGGETIIDRPFTVIAGNSYTVQVGDAGVNGTGAGANPTDGTAGQDSVFDVGGSPLTSTGGGAGIAGDSGQTGGSGGGTQLDASGATPGGSEGFVGGNGADGVASTGGGGGGTPYGVGTTSGAPAGNATANTGAGGGGGTGAGGNDGGDGATGILTVSW